jgi:hypothetical protein
MKMKATPTRAAKGLIRPLAVLILAASAALTAEGASAPTSRKDLPYGKWVFAYRHEGMKDQVFLCQLSCSDGECILATAIVTACDQRVGGPRRSLIVDTTSTRDGTLQVAAERKGDVVVISTEERIPFAFVDYDLKVKMNTDSLGVPKLVNFSGVSRERAAESGTTVSKKLQRLSFDERKNLPPCGLQVMENALEFTVDRSEGR